MNAGVLFKKLNTKAAVTEFLGTGALTLVVALVTSSLSTLSRGQQAVGVGAAVLTLILTGLKSSGANYNPVISLSLLLLGKITLGRGILYLCSQVAGALTGGALARALVGSAGRLRDPSFLLSPPILCMESFFSFALVLLVLHASVSSGAQANGRNQHFAGAIAVFVSVAAALGASMNPAVASGLFLSTGTSQGLGALWAVPVLASIPAVGLYRLSDPDEAIALPSVPAFLSRLLPGGANGSQRIGAWREYMNEGVGAFLLTGTLLFASLTGTEGRKGRRKRREGGG
jgi:glycerol uptake facilitator-like aquaporin